MLYRRFATVFVLRFLWSHFQSQNWAIEKEKTSTEVLLLRFLMLFAVRAGFEPAVRLPVRQFSKLVVSATHPNFLSALISQMQCKITTFFGYAKWLRHFFYEIA